MQGTACTSSLKAPTGDGVAALKSSRRAPLPKVRYFCCVPVNRSEVMLREL